MLNPVEILGFDNGFAAIFCVESSDLISAEFDWIDNISFVISFFTIGFTFCSSSRNGASIINFFFLQSPQQR